MKKFNFSPFLFVLAFIFLYAENSFAQQVNKNFCVVEIGTGTWCYYCPGAAMGADELVENGHLVAIIENHNGDSHTWAGSNARNNYYGVPGYPTAYFNGLNGEVGGSHTQSMYSAYVPKVNAALAVLSDFSLDMSYTNVGPDYDVTIDLEEPGNYAGTNLVVHLVLTESHIAENWQGMTDLNFINRAMFPTFSGTPYTGGTTSLNISFTADAAWDLSNCELVAFVQDVGTKETLQSDKISLAAPEGVNNAGLLTVNEISPTCDLLVSPTLVVKNFGADDITSMDINWSINGGNSTGTFNWTGGPIATFDQDEIVLDDLAFTQLNATNPIDFEITQVNGVADDDPSNNTESASFDVALESATDYIQVFIQTDNNGSECTWTLEDSTGTVVESGGPYANNTPNNIHLYLDEDCYTFTIFDTGGDGGGTVIVADANSDPLYYSDGNYGSGDSGEFSVPFYIGVSEVAFSDSLIFPNPANTTLNIENADGLQVAIIDLLGRALIVNDIATTKQQINVENLAEGTYVVRLTDGIKIRTEKIVISR